MIIVYDSIFGHGKMIVFQLIEWIATNTKGGVACLIKAYWNARYSNAFPVSAIPTRHEVTCLSANQEDNE